MNNRQSLLSNNCYQDYKKFRNYREALDESKINNNQRRTTDPLL